jgi:hypothetical protein
MTTTVPVVRPNTITTQKTIFFMARAPLANPTPHPKRPQSGLVPCTANAEAAKREAPGAGKQGTAVWPLPR